MASVTYSLANGIEMDRPEYFIVRVYRRAPGDSPEVEGVVEVVATLKWQAFASAQDLWAVLLDPSLAQQRSRAPGRANDRTLK